MIGTNDINGNVEIAAAPTPLGKLIDDTGIVSNRSAAGKHVWLLDNYAAFSKDAGYRATWMSDSLHPNDAGYVVLGRAMYDAIKPFVSP